MVPASFVISILAMPVEVETVLVTAVMVSVPALVTKVKTLLDVADAPGAMVRDDGWVPLPSVVLVAAVGVADIATPLVE